MGTDISVEQLFDRYGAELRGLAGALRETYLRMRSAGHGATFSDLDGEVLYLLIRHLRPEVVFEISPDCGYSTNYIAAALAANGTGRLFSFELAPTKHGRSTGEVIRTNLLHPLPGRFELVIGDASERVDAYPDPDLVLLDSCHETWFARWYIEKLFPRIRQLAFVQDVAYHDRPEFAGEAELLIEWLRSRNLPVWSIATFESAPEVGRWRSALAPRRPYENNSVVIPLGGEVSLSGATPLPGLDSPFGNDAPLNDLDLETIDALHQGMLVRPLMPNAQRRWLHLGLAYARNGLTAERDRCYRRAFGCALSAWPEQRDKALLEVAIWFGRRLELRLFASALLTLTVLRPTAALGVLGTLSRGLTNQAGRRILRSLGYRRGP